MFSKKLLYWISKPVISTYANTMLKMDVQMHQQIPDGPKIIAANHPSTSDPFFVAAMLRQQAFILIKGLLFKVPIFGEYLHRSGHIPVAVGKGQMAVETAVDYLKAGHNVIIFPEGSLSPQEGGFHPSRTGVARLALLSGAPVIPVGIHLLRSRIHPIRSTIEGEIEYGRWYLSGPYNLTIGRPLQFTGDVEDRIRVRAVAVQVMSQIIALARESEMRLNQNPGKLSGTVQAF